MCESPNSFTNPGSTQISYNRLNMNSMEAFDKPDLEKLSLDSKNKATRWRYCIAFLLLECATLPITSKINTPSLIAFASTYRVPVLLAASSDGFSLSLLSIFRTVRSLHPNGNKLEPFLQGARKTNEQSEPKSPYLGV